MSFKEIIGGKYKDIAVGNLNLKALLILLAYADKPTPLVVVCPTFEEVKLISDILHNLSLYIFTKSPRPVINSIKRPATHDKPVRAETYRFLYSMLENKNTISILDYSSVLHVMPDPYMFMDWTIEIKDGMQIYREEFISSLHKYGYKRSDLVTEEGEYAKRGFIVDVFVPFSRFPVRIELDEEDTVVSLRIFDHASQRSIKPVDKALIVPIKPIFSLMKRDTVLSAGSSLSVSSYVQGNRINDIINSYENSMDEDSEFLEYLLYDSSIFEFMTENSRIILDEPGDFNEFAGSFKPEFNILNQGIEKKALETIESIKNRIKDGYFLSLRLIPDNVEDLLIASSYLENYHGVIDELIKDIQTYMGRGFKIIIMLPSNRLISNLCGVLENRGISVKKNSDWILEEDGSVHILKSELKRGFKVDLFKLIFISELEIYGHRFEMEKLEQKTGVQEIGDILKLKEGDYIIHDSYGVGKYLGINTIKIDESLIDFVEIMYKEGDKLFIPVYNLNTIHRYASAEKDIVIDRLKSARFAERKARIKEKLLEYASELIDLYAKRSMKKGFAFQRYYDYEDEFDSDFLHEETNDQYRATQEIKADMEKESPMDRVLIGDVGFGKTEVIMRAAYLSVLNNKQVAVLVPTTILVQQHYITFLDRFKGYAVNISMFSRWTDPKSSEKTVNDLKEGKIDIIIGTHKLLAGNIVFRDLGLLIIDEEHKFGVSHKETLRFLKENVDTITLTATPIPRTYYMSVSGLRDISFIATPPKQRLSIKTQIIEGNEKIIREATIREMGRKGQIFFVHNRVDSIYNTRSWLKELIPEARTVIGHAQMKDSELERVMLDFLEKKYDILLCTTIIESGLDIPGVNTIFIDNADKLGLAQLYQLRGRVGRSNIQAYAYLIIKNKRKMSNDGKLRMQAIMNLSELGAGFQLAGYDLDIRGAGNLVGREQSGHIEQLGIDFYTKMLTETVEELRGNKPLSVEDVEIKLDKSAYIPPVYITNVGDRFHYYKKLSNCRNMEALGFVVEEIRDRFGPVPKEVRHVVLLNELRINSSNKGIRSVQLYGNTLVFTMFDNNTIKLDKLLKLVKYNKGKYYLRENKLIVTIKDNSLEGTIKECGLLYEKIF